LLGTAVTPFAPSRRFTSMSELPAQDAATVDELDRAIVHCLQLNGRAQFRRIAELLAVSEQTVARRYRRMRSAGMLRVVAVIKSQPYGQASWLIRIQAKPDAMQTLAHALADREDVTWVTISAGDTEIAAALQSRSVDERDQLILDRLPRHTQVLSVTAQCLMHHFRRADGSDWTVASPLVSEATEKLLHLDAPRPGAHGAPAPSPADEAILEALLTDARVPVTTIAKQAGWSSARATRRVDALLQTGTITLDVDIAAEAFGFYTTVNIWLNVEPAHLTTVGQALCELPQIAFAAAITGTANITAVGLFRDISEVYTFVAERIGPLPGIRKAEISPVLVQVKQAGTLIEHHRITTARSSKRSQHSSGHAPQATKA